MIFKSLRHSNYRLDAVTGKLDSSGSLIADATQGLPPNYIWVRLGDDRTAVPMLSKIRAVAGIDVVVAYDRLWREDVVLEVNLTRTQLDYAAAYNVPQLPANMSTPTGARDIVPGGVFADIAGGLYVRVGPYWHEAGYWDDITPLELTPTATSSKKSLAVVGVDRETNALTYTLTADRSLATNLIINAAPTSYAVADILAVVEADRTVDWRGAVELAHGDTEIDASKIVPLLWIRPVAIGATVSTDGIPGLVPGAVAADKDKFLRGDGTYATPSASSTVPNFGTGVTKTLSSDVASAGTDRHLIIAAQSGTADNLIEITGLNVGDEIIIRADSGDTITVKHNDSGAIDKIILYNGSDLALTGDDTLKLTKTASGTVVQYVDEKGSGGASLSYQQTQRTTDVTLTTAGTYYDVHSLTLGAGTWFIKAQAASNTSSICTFYGKIWDGSSTVWASCGQSAGSGWIVHYGTSAVIVLSGSTTVKFSVTCNVNSQNVVANVNSIGNYACTMTAIQIA